MSFAAAIIIGLQLLLECSADRMLCRRLECTNLQKLAHSQGDTRQGGELAGQIQQLCEAVDECEGGKAGIGHPLGQLTAVHTPRQAPCAAPHQDFDIDPDAVQSSHTQPRSCCIDNSAAELQLSCALCLEGCYHDLARDRQPQGAKLMAACHFDWQQSLFMSSSGCIHSAASMYGRMP